MASPIKYKGMPVPLTVTEESVSKLLSVTLRYTGECAKTRASCTLPGHPTYTYVKEAVLCIHDSLQDHCEYQQPLRL